MAEPDEMRDRRARRRAVLHLDLRERRAGNRLAHRRPSRCRCRAASARPPPARARSAAARHPPGPPARSRPSAPPSRATGPRLPISRPYPPPDKRLVDAAQHVGEERVGDVRHDDEHHHRAPRAQHPRGLVRRVAGAPDRLLDARERLRPQLVRRGERAAHRRGRHAGERRHLRDACQRRGAAPTRFLLRGMFRLTGRAAGKRLSASHVNDYTPRRQPRPAEAHGKPCQEETQ